MQQLQPVSGQIKDVLKYMPAHILNAIEDYADATGLPDEKVVELAFSMFLNLGATSFEELKTAKSPSVILEENLILNDENVRLQQEVEALKARLAETEPTA